jgi:hypothetical protein
VTPLLSSLVSSNLATLVRQAPTKSRRSGCSGFAPYWGLGTATRDFHTARDAMVRLRLSTFPLIAGR